MGRQLGIGQTSFRQGLDARLLQPGHIGAMPKHSGMVGVLRQHLFATDPRQARYIPSHSQALRN